MNVRRLPNNSQGDFEELEIMESYASVGDVLGICNVWRLKYVIMNNNGLLENNDVVVGNNEITMEA